LKIVNKYIQIKWILLGLGIYLSSCSNSNTIINNQLMEVPKVTKTNMSKAIQCMGRKLNNTDSNTAYIFMIRKIIDGTIKDSVYVNGPLADSGAIQLINTLSENTYPHLGMVTDNFPLIFKTINREDMGLNRFGLPSAQNMNTFIKFFQFIINNARKRKRLSPISYIVPMVINGAFTRLDNDNIYQRGYGHNAGVRGDDNNRNSGQIDFGKTSSAKALTLVINLIDPRHNIVVGSQSFDLVFYRKNNKLRFRLAVGDGFYGFSGDEVIVEGLHSAQQTLLDAAALWILDKSYGKQINFSKCLTPKQSVLTQTHPTVIKVKKQNSTVIRAKKQASTPETEK
jgi:hypothetical protein